MAIVPPSTRNNFSPATLRIHPGDTGALLWRWFTTLDAHGRDEARACVLTGTYSRHLLQSLRRALPSAVTSRRGLDDPHTASPGDPLGARVQTLLRERLLTSATRPTAPAAEPPAPHHPSRPVPRPRHSDANHLDGLRRALLCRGVR